VTTGSSHPLAAVLAAAAEGRFPPPDGSVEVLPPDADGTHAVVEFTGHSFVLTDRASADLLARGADGFGGSTQPDVLRWLAGPRGAVGSLDVVLVATARPGDRLAERHDLDDHPRVARARLHRRDVRVFGDDRGLLTLGRGLAGRLELSVELHDGTGRNGGAGRALIGAGIATAPRDELVWAQVAPGNAASLRAFLACGFVPIGSEVLITSR
jgi:hypothetical protein